MGKQVATAVIVLAMVLAGGPGPTTTSYAAGPLEPLTVPLEGACFEGQISPDSAYYVCTGDNDSVTGWELYSVPIDGSVPAIRLSPALFASIDHVSWFDVTADGATVVFAQGSTQWNDEEFDRSLYSVPIGGGDPTPLTPQVVAGDLVWLPELTPDGSRVVFWAYSDTGGGRLQSVLISGEGATTIAEPVNPQWFGPVGSISPDSTRVIYYTGYPADEAHSVEVTGGTPIRISGPNPAGGRIEDGLITPDSSYFVYRADFDTAGVPELYVVPLAGGEATKINHALEASESVLESYQILPDSSGVVYAVSGLVVPTLYFAPIAGGTPVEISPAIDRFFVTQDSSRVIFDNGYVTAHTLDTGQQVVLGDHGSMRVSPDSSTVWLWQKDYTDPVAQLYSVPIEGDELKPYLGAVIPTTRPNAEVDHIPMQITPDSSRFVYAADTDGDGLKELMVVPTAGDDAYSVATDLLVIPPYEPEVNETYLSGIYISSDSRRVVYGNPYLTGPTMYSSLLTRAPEVSDTFWDVNEDEPVGAFVGVVDATDPDNDQLTFAITDGGDTFDIDPESGEITLAATLDRETTAEHQLTVAVDDGIVTSTALVTISVGNINDNPPVSNDLALTVPEDTLPGTVLGTIASTDADGDLLSHSLGSPNSLFSVEADGTVGLLGALDHDTASSHQFTVEVSDGLFTTTATVTINVTTVPDTPPPTTTTTIRPPPPPPLPQFDDVPEHNLFHTDITWLATQRITKGCNPPTNTLFCPDDYVTRGQMAAFLYRALGDTQAGDPPTNFIDDDESVFETDIAWLAASGITYGCNPPRNDKYCPDQPVTRGQMAAFLDRALDLPAPAQRDLFLDDNDSVFETQIDKLAAAGITKGCNPPTNNLYCPDQPVTRGQMAAFLHRALAT